MRLVGVLLILFTWPTQQNQEPWKPTLPETLDWMTHFSAQHGFAYDDNVVVQQTRILKTDGGCGITVEHSFANWDNTAASLKRQTELVVLSELDPNSVHLGKQKYGETESFQVDVERTDAQYKIEGILEHGDGSSMTIKLAQDYFLMDTENNARRFRTALIHVIRLCGGAKAPF